MKSSPSAVHSFVLRYFLRINHLSTLSRLRSLKKKELKQRKEKKKRKKNESSAWSNWMPSSLFRLFSLKREFMRKKKSLFQSVIVDTHTTTYSTRRFGFLVCIFFAAMAHTHKVRDDRWELGLLPWWWMSSAQFPSSRILFGSVCVCI